MSKYSNRVNKIYDYLKSNYSDTRYLTKSNIDLYLTCLKTGDFSIVHKTNIYNKNPSLYVRLVEIAYIIKD